MYRRSFVAFVLLSLALFVAAAYAPAEKAEDSYYMMVFASDAAAGRQPELAHTFATFAHVRRAPGAKPEVEAHTISWLPRSLRVVVVRLYAEPGVNLDLAATLQWARALGANVSAWGPYEIQQPLYQRALAQEARLNSGTVLYKAIDERFRPAEASNCIHAVSDVDPENGALHVGQQWGESASYAVARHLSRWIIGPEQTHPWLIDELGIKDYPLQMRTLP